MSELVQIAPGVVFSSDVLGIAWMRKYRPDGGNVSPTGNAQSAVRPGRSDEEGDQVGRASMSGQLSLL
ncbi:hypothetical protein DIE23_28980 [Burkholderia sp. Bp9143]|uniref:hypothetical protein n=1 Tax=Burkholderia sp. Bp9143 TaxID=2184574 RepID=UPI000F5AABE6|nr:hypothetical protein [Burkholderia sp. Bp9143]RQR26687.1 hypothetical protein DIE23_28980 [Burkholderia sp. Bp9143]